jgi:hypothetical protein
MLKRAVMLLAVLISTTSWSRAQAPDQAPALPSLGAADQRTRGPEEGLIWKIRVNGSDISLDGFAARPDGALNWRLSYSAWAYFAAFKDSSPPGFSRYGVSGLGAGFEVYRVRAGDLVVLFSVSEPAN